MYVVSHFDEDRTVPAEYALKSGDGWDAIVINEDYDPVLLGKFATANLALRAIWGWSHLDWVHMSAMINGTKKGVN
jgi:hypothetical protein